MLTWLREKLISVWWVDWTNWAFLHGKLFLHCKKLIKMVRNHIDDMTKRLENMNTLIIVIAARMSAKVIVAEISGNMSRFPTAGHLGHLPLWFKSKKKINFYLRQLKRLDGAPSPGCCLSKHLKTVISVFKKSFFFLFWQRKLSQKRNEHIYEFIGHWFVWFRNVLGLKK